MSKPPSIGDAAPEFVLSRYEEPLPETRREVVTLFSSILNRGGVQKVTIELGRPIQVVQLVDKSMAVPPTEAPVDELWAAIHNSKMEEFLVPENMKLWMTGTKSEKWSSFMTLFFAFAELSGKDLKPKALFCHDYGQLQQWLYLPDRFRVSSVFGIDAKEEADVPEDAVILAGVPQDENYLNTVGLRVPVDLPRRKS
jgi:hypothetical protein